MRAPRALAALALVALAGLVAACGDDDGGGNGGASGGDGQERRAVTVMLNWSPNTHHIGLYAALEEGWFDEAGLDVTLVEPGEGGAEQAVAAGRAQLGISVAEGVLPAREQGLPIVSVATVLPVNDSSLMSLASDGITRPRDLEGKLYGGYGGPLETELLRALVTCDGGNPDALRQVEIGNVEYLPGMEQDRFDVVWVFDGWDVQRARVQGVDVATIPFRDWADCIPNWYTPLFIASEATVADDPELVRTFFDVAARGYQLAAEDPDRAADLFLAAVPELDADLVRASAAYYAPLWQEEGRPWGHQDAEVWADFEEFLRGAGALERPVDTSEAFTNALLPSRS